MLEHAMRTNLMYVCVRACVLCVHRVSDNERINSHEQIKWINQKALYYLNICAIGEILISKDRRIAQPTAKYKRATSPLS